MKNVSRKILRSFKRFSDFVLSVFASRIYNFTSTSKELPNPTPTMAELLDAINEFNKIMTATDLSASVQAERKKQARDSLMELLDRLADYVTLIAKGNAAIMAESGFYLTKIPGPRHIDAPENVILTEGKNPGEITDDCNAVKGAVSYVHQISSDPLLPEDSWSGVASSLKTYTHKNLEPGKRYYCRIASVGTKNQQYWSKVVSRIAQ